MHALASFNYYNPPPFYEALGIVWGLLILVLCWWIGRPLLGVLIGALAWGFGGWFVEGSGGGDMAQYIGGLSGICCAGIGAVLGGLCGARGRSRLKRRRERMAVEVASDAFTEKLCLGCGARYATGLGCCPQCQGTAWKRP